MSELHHIVLGAAITFLCFEVATLRRTRLDWLLAWFWAALVIIRVSFDVAGVIP